MPARQRTAPLRGWSAFLAPRKPAANHVTRYTHRPSATSPRCYIRSRSLWSAVTRRCITRRQHSYLAAPVNLTRRVVIEFSTKCLSPLLCSARFHAACWNALSRFRQKCVIRNGYTCSGIYFKASQEIDFFY